MKRKLFAFSCIAFLILIDMPVQARQLEDRIVFVSERRGTPEIFLVEGLDGRPFQLTRNLFASSPSISPDGTEIVFISYPPTHAANILKLNIAKRRIEQLTHNAKQDIRYRSLDWSPDGREILFIMVTGPLEDPRTDLCVMDIKGRHIRHILQPDPPTRISDPSWAPDSNRILYYQDTRDSSGIFIIDDNGNNVVRVPHDQRRPAFLPTWSLKRNQIGYIDAVGTRHVPRNPLQIYMMDLVEESVTALTSGGNEENIPLAWHPDGQKILFVTLSFLDQEILGSDLFVMDNNGENIINLTQTPEMEMAASWSPDGGQIVFDRAVGEDEIAIFIMGGGRSKPAATHVSTRSKLRTLLVSRRKQNCLPLIPEIAYPESTRWIQMVKMSNKSCIISAKLMGRQLGPQMAGGLRLCLAIVRDVGDSMLRIHKVTTKI